MGKCQREHCCRDDADADCASRDAAEAPRSHSQYVFRYGKSASAPGVSLLFVKGDSL